MIFVSLSCLINTTLILLDENDHVISSDSESEECVGDEHSDEEDKNSDVGGKHS